MTYALLNLTHRNGHEHPSPLEPGRNYDIDLSCYFTAHRFKKGNRICVAVTESLWPMVWPSPHPVTLSNVTGESRLLLPVRPKESYDQAPQIPLIRDRIQQTTSVAEPPPLPVPNAEGRVTIESNGSFASIQEGDPNSCVWKFQRRRVLQGETEVTLETSCELTSTPDDCYLKESVRAMEGNKVVLDRKWDSVIKRDLV